MNRAVLHSTGLGCFLALLLVIYRPVLFEGGQFAYRDAGGNYYPLYLRVQQEWDAGRWPLWDPGQNGGMPLLGNPMAAVFYPGKLVYALLPYAWAARLYVIAHTVIAFVGMLALGRSCGVSWVGSYLGGLSYALGAPILFQYDNVIYLVGAAWIPWGLCAIDRLLCQGRRRGVVELAVVLALQVLGGDPESAYLTAVCGAGYAAILASRDNVRVTRFFTWPCALGVMGIWVVATLGLTYFRIAVPQLLPSSLLLLGAWFVVAIGVVWLWHRRRDEARPASMLLRLAGACTLAMALAGVQVVPALEFVGQSRRMAGDGAINVFRFSLDPFRVVELFWPNVFGRPCPENRSWLQAVPPAGEHDAWVDSLYMGGMTLVLGLAAAGWKGGPTWRVWLTALVVVGLLISFGKYAGPLWWVRWGAFEFTLGPHDPVRGQPRADSFVSDGFASPYGVLAMLLPGFGAFRYPSKVLSFSAAALAVLAGAGWDRATGGETRRLLRLGRLGLGTSFIGLVLALAARDGVVAYLAGRVLPDAGFGPADIDGAWAMTQRALAHGAIVFAAVLALAQLAPRRPRRASAMAVLLLASDLAVANAGLVWTAPQSEFETSSEAARLIDAAERSDLRLV